MMSLLSTFERISTRLSRLRASSSNPNVVISILLITSFSKTNMISPHLSPSLFYALTCAIPYFILFSYLFLYDVTLLSVLTAVGTLLISLFKDTSKSSLLLSSSSALSMFTKVLLFSGSNFSKGIVVLISYYVLFRSN